MRGLIEGPTNFTLFQDFVGIVHQVEIAAILIRQRPFLLVSGGMSQLGCNFIITFLGSAALTSRAPFRVAAAQAENTRGGPKRHRPSTEKGKRGPPFDKSRRLSKSARTIYDAVNPGPLSAHGGPSPQEATVETQWPISFTLRGISTPCFRSVSAFCAKSNWHPSASRALLHSTAGMSAFRTNATKLLLHPSIPTSISAAGCTSPILLSPNSGRAVAG